MGHSVCNNPDYKLSYGGNYDCGCPYFGKEQSLCNGYQPKELQGRLCLNEKGEAWYEKESPMNKYAVVKESNNKYEGFSQLHITLHEAREEAERLCRKEKACFYVVELLEKCFMNEQPVTWVKL